MFIKKQEKFIQLSILLFFSIGGMLIWQREIISIHSGEGLYWLNRNLVSPFIIALFPAITFLFPFVIKTKKVTSKTIISIVLLYLLNIFCYLLGKELCFLMYCRFCGWTFFELILLLISGILLFAILGLGFWLITSKLLQSIPKKKYFIITTLAFLVIPLSLLTSQFYPFFANQTDWVNTVKSGYTVFWIIFLLGVSGMLTFKEV